MADAAPTMVRRAGPFTERPTVSVALLPTATRFVFRGPPEAAEACEPAFGCPLPRALNRATLANDRAALSLGPDEWHLFAAESDGPDIRTAIEAALGTVPHALVDVSHRQVGFDVAGASGATLLNTGCPLDLDLVAFPAGMATRTILAKADVTLWRQASDRFRLEVARSFAPYVRDFLKAAEAGL